MVNHRDLLRQHLEAVWYIHLPHELDSEVTLLPDSLRPPWDLYVAALDGEYLAIWSEPGEHPRKAALLEMARLALAAPATAAQPQHISREAALQQSAQPSMSIEQARQITRPLAINELQLFEDFEKDSATYYTDAARQPLFGVVQEQHILCIAHSSRRTQEVCELGIDTLPASRRKGYALASTLRWAEAVRQEGLEPIYSALLENTASLKLAHAAGYREFARGVHIDTTEI